MKRFLFLLTLLLLAGVAGAQSPVIPNNAFTLTTSQLTGGRQVIGYYSGQDTVSSVDFMAASGHDTLVSSGWLQLAGKVAGAGTYPNMTLSDSLVALDADKMWLWVKLDSTALQSGSSSGYSAVAAVDSLGLQRMSLRFALLAGDTTLGGAIWADTTQRLMVSGAYNLPFYGVWQYEPMTALTEANYLDGWRVFSARVPACMWVKVQARSYDTLADFVIWQWRLVFTN